jgi:hypothetical protein
MSAKKLGRFAAGLFVALGLAFGGCLLADTGGNVAVVAAPAATVGAPAALVDFEWA